VDLQSAREESIQSIAAQVDELNKAIDVMTTALFIVCERFNRFKNGKTCLKVMSQPDVAEPKRWFRTPLIAADSARVCHM
jgi:predicted GTPase